MHFFGAILGFASLASAATVTYSDAYSSLSQSVDTFACSSGQNGFKVKYNWQTLSQIPGNYGAWSGALVNTESCLTCHNITVGTQFIYLLAVDNAGGERGESFVISQAALDHLTNGQAEVFGSVQADTEKVNDLSLCGIKA